ncbi:hypothetical protein TSUD_254190 [Trifolium subterraneum]|uniref:Uncharacterized protein n=1 Tax=Trifolium subterraneum TaxID=3900 RepID=A0A2Z6P3H1_TRISU|nr:hypothetical protein TSUD_254190 [Trifolium subterraneum]
MDALSIRGVGATGVEKYNSMNSNDGKGALSMLSFETDKIRLLRSLIIETETMQVLDFTVFPKAEYDVPIFCANFFTTAKTNIVVLDLNPLHDIINQNDYKEKYFESLIPLGLKYAEVWLELIDTAVKETDEYQIIRNLEAQHRYLTWRAEKDPGQGVLKKLIGDTLAKDLLRSFLFNGVDELGSKTFDDYFPHYHSEEGTLNKKGGNVGKSFENRPWDASGKFLVMKMILGTMADSVLHLYRMVTNANQQVTPVTAVANQKREKLTVNEYRSLCTRLHSNWLNFFDSCSASEY